MKIGVITDIHEDALSLQKALTGLEKRNSDVIVCLGDIAGFDKRFYSYATTRDLSFCLDALKANCIISITGNHDLNCIKKIPLSGSVFKYPDNWYELTVEQRKLLAQGKVLVYEQDAPVILNDSEKELLFNMPAFSIFQVEEIKIYFSHNIFPDISGNLTKKPNGHKDFFQHFSIIKENNCNFGISGHYHPNGLFTVNEQKKRLLRFGINKFDNAIAHYICPCIAEGTQDSGFTLIDTGQQTIESIPIRTYSYNLMKG